MSPQESKKTDRVDLTIVLGFVIMLGARALQSPQSKIVVGGIGAVIFVVGCMFYAKKKGYSPVVGLLGIFSLIGLIILYLLPDKSKIVIKPSPSFEKK